MGLGTLPWSPLLRWRFGWAGSLRLSCRFGFAALCLGRWGGGGGVGSLQGERGRGSSPASQSLSCCWHGHARAVAITRDSGSLQRFSFLPSLISCDTMKALELRRRRLAWELSMFVLKLFSWIFGPVSPLQYKATAREPRWKSAKYVFVNLVSLSVFRPGFNTTFKLLSPCFCCIVPTRRTEGVPVTPPEIAWALVPVQLPLLAWAALQFHVHL